jgi:hypothetical protein
LTTIDGARRQVALVCTEADRGELLEDLLERRDADAALIAAAPDLAEALSRVLKAAEWLDVEDDGEDGSLQAFEAATEQAVAALRKAGAL